MIKRLWKHGILLGLTLLLFHTPSLSIAWQADLLLKSYLSLLLIVACFCLGRSPFFFAVASLEFFALMYNLALFFSYLLGIGALHYSYTGLMTMLFYCQLAAIFAGAANVEYRHLQQLPNRSRLSGSGNKGAGLHSRQLEGVK
jgi:hypothetical protein